MAAIAQSFPTLNGSPAWLWNWLKDELTPYPGRARQVFRMVLAAALVIIIGMTFRIPFAWQGALYALLVSRANPRATLETASAVFIVTGLGAAYLIVSMALVVNDPPLHFLWIVATFFIAFYAISTLTSYLAAVAFVNTISLGIPLWDRHVSAETNVEDTLWLLLAVLIAVVVTGAVELTCIRQHPGDDIILPMTERLSAVEALLNCYAEGCAPDAEAERKILRLATVGTSTLRHVLRRSNLRLPYSAPVGGVAVLIGRLVDLGATLRPLNSDLPADDRRRFRSLASTLAGIRRDLMNRNIPAPVQFNTETEAAVPLLGEMEHTVTLITDVCEGARPGQDYATLPDEAHRPRLLSEDAFTNSDHLRFALKGCLAASLCYVLYNAIDWHGISTSVTTCLLTSLSTIGASRQKQILRFAGAVVGGFALGIGSQAFVLPYVDSITGFLVLFVIATALSSWVMTSSPRLSYFGVQVALAFYLVNVQEFKLQTSLAVARDRVAGILLGLFMMWFVFDRLWSSPASAEMKRTLVSILRQLAEFARLPSAKDFKVALGHSLALRETINTNLDKVRALADVILFEFGPSRQKNLELRSRIREWQPQLRTLFIMRIAALKYRLRLPGFESPEIVGLRQQAYDESLARMLDEIADEIEGKTIAGSDMVDRSHKFVSSMIEVKSDGSERLSDGGAQSFVTLLRRIDTVTNCLAREIANVNWHVA